MLQQAPINRCATCVKAALYLLCTAAFVSAQLIISELYRDPPGAEGEMGGGASHEFIEITNLNSDTTRLDALFITNGIESDSVIPIKDTLPGYASCRYNCRVLAPGASAVILDPDYRNSLRDNALYRFTIPDATVLLECGDTKFGSSGLASDHGIFLYRGSGNRIDTALFIAADIPEIPATPTSGRITLSYPENHEGVAIEIVNILSGAPNFDYCESGLSPGSYDAIRNGWLLESATGNYDRTSRTVACSLRVQCLEQQTAAAPWQIDAFRSGSWQKASSGTIGLSAHHGAAVFRLPADSVPVRVVLLVNSSPSWTVDLSVAWLPGTSIRITELFPKATPSEPEWFELHNASTMPVNLKNWRFGNADDTVVLAVTGIRLEAGEFAIVTKSAPFFASSHRGIKKIIEPPQWHVLDNSRDSIMLLDGSGGSRETVCYDADWFTAWPSLSLERNLGEDGCSQSSWVVAQRATPGQPNAARSWRNDVSPALDIGPLPFSPDNDGSDDLLAIRLSLPAAASATIDIYGFDGRILKRFTGAPQEVVYWNGRADAGFAPPGPFFVVANVVQGSKTVHLRKKGVLWRK